MQVTLEIPDDLGERLKAYLSSHPDETVFTLVRQALEIKLLPKDSSQLLMLAGIVSDAPQNARDRVEDQVT